MAASTFIKVATVILAALLASGCKKPLPAASAEKTNAVPIMANGASGDTNAAPGDTNAPPVPFAPRGKDFGVVLLTNRCETRIQVGDGKSCAITPLLLDAQRLRLTMALESRLADGTTRGLKIMTVVARPNQPFEVDFGSLVFALTPQMVTNSSPAP